MPLRFTKTMVKFEGICGPEETPELVEWLQGRTRRPGVDLSRCSHLHTALLQALLSARVPLDKPPLEPFLAQWVTPLFPPRDDGTRKSPRPRSLAASQPL